MNTLQGLSSNVSTKARQTLSLLLHSKTHFSTISIALGIALSSGACSQSPSGLSASFDEDVLEFMGHYDRVKLNPDFGRGLQNAWNFDFKNFGQAPDKIALGRTTFSDVQSVISRSNAAIGSDKKPVSGALGKHLESNGALTQSIGPTDVDNLFKVAGGFLRTKGDPIEVKRFLTQYSSKQVASALNAALIYDLTNLLSTKNTRTNVTGGLKLLGPTLQNVTNIFGAVSNGTGAASSLTGSIAQLKSSQAEAEKIKAETQQIQQTTAQSQLEFECNTADVKMLCVNKASYPSIINGAEKCTYKQYSCDHCEDPNDSQSCTFHVLVSAPVTAPMAQAAGATAPSTSKDQSQP